MNAQLLDISRLLPPVFTLCSHLTPDPTSATADPVPTLNLDRSPRKENLGGDDGSGGADSIRDERICGVAHESEMRRLPHRTNAFGNQTGQDILISHD